jgi:hypothetical protein
MYKIANASFTAEVYYVYQAKLDYSGNAVAKSFKKHRKPSPPAKKEVVRIK